MDNSLSPLMPILHGLPPTLPPDGSIALEIEQGVAIFRVSPSVQTHIEELLDKQRLTGLSQDEEKELDQYEEIDDYLSYINRLLRKITLAQESSDAPLS